MDKDEAYPTTKPASAPMDDGLLPRWVLKIANGGGVFIGIWMSTGRFWPAFWVAAVTTFMAGIGIGWQALQFVSVGSLVFGILRVFGAI